MVLCRTTLAAVILDYAGLYCEDSWGLGWGHIYVSPLIYCWSVRPLTDSQITLVVSISVSIAMYCLIQLYFAVKVELAPQKPLLKLFAIKAVGERHLYSVCHTFALTSSSLLDVLAGHVIVGVYFVWNCQRR